MRIVITLPDDFVCAFMDVIEKNKDGSYTNTPRIIARSEAESAQLPAPEDAQRDA